MSRVAVDYYLREIASGSGWGSMDVGGAYSSVGPAGGVTDGYGFIASASNANARYKYVTGLGMGDALIMGRWSADLAPVTGDYQVAVMGRVLSDQTNYQLRALVSATLGNIQLRLVRRTSGTTATIVDSTDTGIPFVAGAWYWLKLQTLGSSPTTLRGRIWREGSPEPTTWLIDTTNNTAGNQTSAGGVGWQYVMSASNPATVEMRATDLLAHARPDDVPLALWLPSRRAAHVDLGVAVQ
ncbi:hypothetical protein BH23CHL7_BH23CHL7_17420 [soil metagenome]